MKDVEKVTQIPLKKLFWANILLLIMSASLWKKGKGKKRLFEQALVLQALSP